MNLHLPGFSAAGLKGRLRGMFNLNDPRWGRGDDTRSENNGNNNNNRPDGRPPKGINQGPPDLDELWRDFNRKLSGLFSGGRGGDGGNQGGNGSNGPGGSMSPDPTGAGIGIGLVAGLVVLVWLGSEIGRAHV